MIIVAIPAPTAVLRTLTQATLKQHPRWQPICQLRSPSLRLTRRPNHPRCFAHQPPTPNASNTREALKRPANPAAQSEKHHEIPERLIIYHAGTGRITFLAMLKLTSLFLGAFFLLIVPSSIKAEKPPPATAAVALCGIIPMLFIAYSTAPFVTHMHMHLPATARTSPAALRRFVAALPPRTPLTLTTMSILATPRHSAVRAGDLRAAVARKRMGLVNYVRDVRDTRADNARRKWYMYRALGDFYVQDAAGVAGVAGGQAGTGYQGTKKKKKTAVDTWIWEALRDKIAKRAASGSV